MKSIKGRKGFTLFELVLVIAIAALIVMLLVPVVRNRHNSDIALANQANIKAAISAAENRFVSGTFSTNYTDNVKGETRYFSYFRYDTSTEIIDRISELEQEDGMPLGIEAMNTALDNEICDFIIVWVGYGDSQELEYKTAPFYEDGSVGGSERNPFG